MPENYITVPGGQGSVHISEEVITAIVGTAIDETEGVAGLTAFSGPDFGERLGLKSASSASASRGVSVTFGEDLTVRVDAAIYARYGESIAAIGERAQQSAAAAVESMTGLPCEVNVHVAGVTFDR